MCLNHQNPVLHHHGSQHTAHVSTHLVCLLRQARGWCVPIRSTPGPHGPAFCDKQEGTVGLFVVLRTHTGPAFCDKQEGTVNLFVVPRTHTGPSFYDKQEGVVGLFVVPRTHTSPAFCDKQESAVNLFVVPRDPLIFADDFSKNRPVITIIYITI